MMDFCRHVNHMMWYYCRLFIPVTEYNGIYSLNDTYNVTDRFFAIFSKLFKMLVQNFQESEKNISDEF